MWTTSRSRVPFPSGHRIGLAFARKCSRHFRDPPRHDFPEGECSERPRQKPLGQAPSESHLPKSMNAWNGKTSEPCETEQSFLRGTKPFHESITGHTVHSFLRHWKIVETSLDAHTIASALFHRKIERE